MSNAGISYRVQQLGLEGVRNRLREINDELRAGAPATKGLKTEVRELGTQITTQTRVVRLNEQAWSAGHRTMQTSARIMSSVGSVARSLLVATTAMSVAFLAFGKTNTELANTRSEIELVSAQIADAIARGADQETISALEERLNELRTTLKNLEQQELQGTITSTINTVASFALLGSGVLNLLPRLAALRVGLLGTTVTMTALSPAISVASVSTRTFGMALRTVWAALGPIGWAILALSIIIPLLIEYWPEITAAFMGFIDFMSSVFGPALTAIWEGIKAGALSFWNGMITLVNLAGLGLVKGIETIANSFIAFVNGIIDGYNSVAGILGLGFIGRLPSVAIPFTAIPVISAATGFSGMLGRDTMFMAHKGEDVRITPASQTSRGGGAGNVTINVYGDVSGDELINKVRMRIKDNLRYDQGYTGF